MYSFLQNSIQSLSWQMLVVSVLVSMVVGAIWYSPLLFGKEWMEERNLSNEDLINGRPLLLVILLNFFFLFVSCLGLALVIPEDSCWKDGTLIGFFVSLVWVIASKANCTLFDQHSIRLFFIHAGFDVFTFSTMGAIIGCWS